MNVTKTTVYKGIAILLVVICHSVGNFGHGFRFFTPLGGVGVAIFLLLSAYGLNEAWIEKTNVGETKIQHCWWRKRFIAVWVPYIIVQLSLYWPFHEFKMIEFIYDITLIKPLYHNGWYLQYLLMWYLIFYIVRSIGLSDKYRLIIFGVISVITFFILREIKAEQSLSFFMGVLLSDKKILQKKLFKLRLGLLFLLFGIMCLAVKQLPIIRSAPQLVMNLVQLGIKLPIGVGLIILAHEVMKKWKLQVLYAVGIISYELYLIHGYVLSAVPSSLQGVFLFVMITIIGSVTCWFIMKLMKPLLCKCFMITKC